MTMTRTLGIRGKSFIESLSPLHQLRLCLAWGWGLGQQRATLLPAMATCPLIPWGALGPPGSCQTQAGGPQGWDSGLDGTPVPSYAPPPCSAPTREQLEGATVATLGAPPTGASPATLRGQGPGLDEISHPGVPWGRAGTPGQSQLCIVVVWGPAGDSLATGWNTGTRQGCQHQAGTPAVNRDTGSSGIFSACPREDEGSISPAQGAWWPQILGQRTEKSA